MNILALTGVLLPWELQNLSALQTPDLGIHLNSITSCLCDIENVTSILYLSQFLYLPNANDTSQSCIKIL